MSQSAHLPLLCGGTGPGLDGIGHKVVETLWLVGVQLRVAALGVQDAVGGVDVRRVCKPQGLRQRLKP